MARLYRLPWPLREEEVGMRKKPRSPQGSPHLQSQGGRWTGGQRMTRVTAEDKWTVGYCWHFLQDAPGCRCNGTH